MTRYTTKDSSGNIVFTQEILEKGIECFTEEIAEKLHKLEELQEPKSKPAMFDDESLECLHCGNDITNANIEEDIIFCQYCGGKLK